MEITVKIILTNLRWIKGSNREGKRYKTVVIPVSKETRPFDIFSWDDCKTKNTNYHKEKARFHVKSIFKSKVVYITMHMADSGTNVKLCFVKSDSISFTPRISFLEGW